MHWKEEMYFVSKRRKQCVIPKQFLMIPEKEFVSNGHVPYGHVPDCFSQFFTHCTQEVSQGNIYFCVRILPLIGLSGHGSVLDVWLSVLGILVVTYLIFLFRK